MRAKLNPVISISLIILFTFLIYDEIIAKAHELHLNRLFQECRTPGGYKNVNRWEWYKTI